MFPISLSPLLDRFAEPETLRMAKLARELNSQGKKIIGLSLGEPDFDTPDHIKKAAIRAIEENWTHYPPVSGYLDLREAICKKLMDENGLSYTADEIIVSTGAKQSIANLIHTLISEGDEVIIPSPFWVTYSEIVKMAGGVPVTILTSMENKFKIVAPELEQAITSRSKLFMFSSPCNPTGSFYHADELEELAAVFMRHPQLFVMSDEIYEYINYSDKHVSIASIDGMKERTAVINGLSKGFAMTGWRIGYMAAPLSIVKACDKIQGQITSGANSIAQRAAIAALQDVEKEETKKMKATFFKRKELILSMLKEIPGVQTVDPEGAFYVFPKIDAYIGKTWKGGEIHGSSDLSMYLLQEAFVSTVAGSSFGMEGYIRLSFAASEKDIQSAMLQVRKALEVLT